MFDTVIVLTCLKSGVKSPCKFMLLFH